MNVYTMQDSLVSAIQKYIAVRAAYLNVRYASDKGRRWHKGYPSCEILHEKCMVQWDALEQVLDTFVVKNGLLPAITAGMILRHFKPILLNAEFMGEDEILDYLDVLVFAMQNGMEDELNDALSA